MLKKIFLLLFIFMFLTIPFTITYAYNSNELIRVGLEYKYKNVSSISISNSSIEVGFESNYKFISCGVIDISNGCNAKISSPYYLEVNQTFSSYEDALNYSNSQRFSNSTYKLIPALIENNIWKIYIGGFNSKSDAENFASNVPNSKLIQTSNFAVSLYNNKNEIIVFNNISSSPQIKEPNGISTTLNDRAYRGAIELYRSSSLLTAINVLSIDEYLFSVVPSEMPSQWNKEALKAQAVACRNYAFSRKGIHSTNGYDLCDSTHCQTYKGSINENQNSSNAVEETSGLMIYYNNNLINAVYHSSSGGYTESSENVWSYSEQYLRGVPEIYEPTAKIWTRSFTLSEITDLLNKNNTNIGAAVNVYISSFSPSNRVNQLVIEGTNGKKVLEKEDIRNFFSASKDGVLESRNFNILGSSNSAYNSTVSVISAYITGTNDIRNIYAINSKGESINYINSTSNVINTIGNSSSNLIVLNNSNQNTNTSNNSNNGIITFSGKGWGHGVGMSQHGANGMAEKGYTFEQILKHYYTGVEIK